MLNPFSRSFPWTALLLRYAFVAWAIVPGPSSAQEAALPSKAEAEAFIRENISDVALYRNEFKGVLSVDCTGISVKDKVYRSFTQTGTESIHMWRPTDVEYKEPESRREQGVWVNCVTGSCIGTNVTYSESGERSSTPTSSLWIGSKVSRDRLHRALLVHQTHCGGKKKSAF